MKQKSDFKKWIEKETGTYNPMSLLSIKKEIEIAGFNILSDREVEKMLARFAKKLLEGENWKSMVFEIDIKEFIKNWKKKRRRE